MRRLPLVLMLFSLLPAATAAAQATGDILPFKATEVTLPNGLRVIVVPTGFPNIVSLQIPVQTGSRNEVEPGRSGFAHFFEHLMFRGTPSTPPARFQQIMVKAGARENAGTGDDATVYYATFAKDDLEQMLAVYADMFQHLAYSEADFRTESRAILGEYNKNSANPLEKLFEVQRARAFTTHTYKHTTMGFLEDIERMPGLYDYSKEFFRRWYRPQFTTIVVAGDVDAPSVMSLVKKYWGDWMPEAGPAVQIPTEPDPQGPLYVHVPWAAPTLPYVTVAFRAPAFSETGKDYAAMDLLATLFFGRTSALYKKLVVDEQKVDQFFAENPGNVDPGLFTVVARVKKPADALAVRDAILETVARACAAPVAAARLEEAKSSSRYGLVRSLDSTERIAGLVGRFAHYRRSYATVNDLYRVVASLEPADLQRAARKYFTDASLIVTTLAHEPLTDAVGQLPALASVSPAPVPAAAVAQERASGQPRMVAPGRDDALGGTPSFPVIVQASATPLLDVKLLFSAGSAADPRGKEGLATLAAAMIAEAGSRTMTVDEIEAALYPMAASFTAQVDKEMTTFTGVVHRDTWPRFLDVVLPRLLAPGFRQEDFARLKAAQLNALVEDLRASNEEELAKERLQTNIFRGTPYGHPALGTIAGIQAITLDDVKHFVAQNYTRANLRLGASGDVPETMLGLLQQGLSQLPAGVSARPTAFEGTRPSGLEVEILEKDTRSTAISLGLPMDVTRSHPDFAALSVARSWLGEHRASSGRLYQRLREIRGMNYGDYAYIEAFPRGMFRSFPDPNLGRRRQIFEIWIRPVVPEQAHMALRLAVHELDRLLTEGLSQEEFEQTRDYLLKNVFVMTARQDQQLGYALDSAWYGTGEFTASMRKAVSSLTREQVNAAVRRHWSAKDLSVVMVTKDAVGLRQQLVTDAFSPMKYEGEKPASLLAEDKVVGARKLNIDPARVRITPIAEVWAR